MNSNPPQSNEVPTPDIESLVCEDIKARQEKGIKKYGMTVAMNPATLKEKLQHGYEEGLDRAIYDKWAILHVEQLQRELAEAKESSTKWAGIAGSFAGEAEKLKTELSLLTKPIEPVRLRIAVEFVEGLLDMSPSAFCEYNTDVNARMMVKNLVLAVRQREGMGDKVLNLHALIGLLIGALEGCKMQVDAGLKQRIDNVLEKVLNQLKTGGDGK